jgi:hypothetical protein
MALARHWEAKGEKRQAADLVSIASKLAPMRTRVQLQAADFWLRQAQIDRALVHWSVALRSEPAIHDRLYPVMLHLLENSATRPAFVTLLQDPPEWWDDFFDYVADQAITLDTLRGVYRMRSGDSHPPSLAERSSFMRRLEREKQWLELYFVWLGSLDSQQLQVLGNVYNGSFELPLADKDVENEHAAPIGFDWRAPKIRGVTVETAHTYGIRGNKALHVVFQGLRVHFQHLYQYLLLDPGKYQLRGWVRPEALQTERGVQWTVSCVDYESDGCELRMRSVSHDSDKTQLINQFKAEFESKKDVCAVLIVAVSTNATKEWTVAGYDDAGEFKTVLISDTNDELAKELKKAGGANRNKLITLATSNLGRTRSNVLGASDRFLGSDQWRSFIIDFAVPATHCQVQLLRLELAGRVALEFEARGSIWFENLAITRVE